MILNSYRALEISIPFQRMRFITYRTDYSNAPNSLFGALAQLISLPHNADVDEIKIQLKQKYSNTNAVVIVPTNMTSAVMKAFEPADLIIFNQTIPSNYPVILFDSGYKYAEEVGEHWIRLGLNKKSIEIHQLRQAKKGEN